jgi:hypothetical protein
MKKEVAMNEAQIQMMKQEGYVPAAKAAEVSGVVVTTIHRWIGAGKVEGSKVGDYWYVTVDSLIARLGPVAAKAAGLLNGDQDAVEDPQLIHHG